MSWCMHAKHLLKHAVTFLRMHILLDSVAHSVKKGKTASIIKQTNQKKDEPNKMWFSVAGFKEQQTEWNWQAEKLEEGKRKPRETSWEQNDEVHLLHVCCAPAPKLALGGHVPARDTSADLIYCHLPSPSHPCKVFWRTTVKQCNISLMCSLICIWA